MKLALLLVCLFVSSCELLTPHPKPKPRLAVFDEAEYAPYAPPGTGAIEGQAFMTQRNGGVVVGAGRMVTLNPVTTYSTEWFERDTLKYEALESPDPRAASFNRKAIADGEGRFRFENLAPGKYYLACKIMWEVPQGHYTTETGGIGHAEVTVEDGKTTHAVVTR